ncbi:MAG: hypothetical protein R2828_28515 [Saprospiraceae bacterium]
MKKFFLSITCILALAACMDKTENAIVIDDDIDHFWQAYDKIIATNDSTLQYQLLNELFIEKGTPGLKAFMERRSYTPASYINAINNYPLFWSSIRANTLKSKAYGQDIAFEIKKLKQLYPDLKPAKIYFTIGALMSNGTTMDSLVLIGAESAMADSATVTEELPGRLGENLRKYFDSNPIQHVVLLNVHEYVHTQQNTYGYDLLSQSLFEGVAEFVSVTAAGKPSSTPSVHYGKNNEGRVKERFAKEMFSPDWSNWLYNNFDNEFKMRDLGYYIGYALCEKYYEAAPDKKQAIKRLIELDFGNRAVIESFVEETGYFGKSISALNAEYEQGVPKVIGIKPFNNGDQKVPPGLTQVTITFSTKMDTRFRGFDYGPLGEDHVLSVKNVIGFSADETAITIEVEPKPNQRYQVFLTDRFKSIDGLFLQPYLIDIRTGEK